MRKLLAFASSGTTRVTVGSMLCGVLAGMSFDLPVGWMWIQVALIAHCGLLSAPHMPPATGAARSAAFAAAYLGTAYIGIAIGAPAASREVVCAVLFCIVFANSAMAWVFTFVAFRVHRNWAVRIAVLLPVGWAVREWLTGCGRLALPWMRLGNAQAAVGPLAGLLPLGGSLLASGTMVFVSALVVGAWTCRRRRAWCVGGILGTLVVAQAAAAVEWTQPTGRLTADLIQPGREQPVPALDDGGTKAVRDAVLATHAQLVVTPQLAIRKIAAALPDGYASELATTLRTHHADAVIGMYFDDATHAAPYNGLLGIGMSGTQRYLKYQLFPFGEFMPLPASLTRWVHSRFPRQFQERSRPDSVGDALFVAGHRIAPAICFEAAFAAHWRAAAVMADVLLNVSSDTALQNRQLARQFLQIAQTRAIEFQKPLLRTSDRDGTYAIDAHGVVTAALPPDSPAVLHVTVIPRSGLTPYARFGDALPLGIGAVLAGVGLLMSGRRSGSTTTMDRWSPRPTPEARRRQPLLATHQSGQVLPLSLCLILIAGALFYFMVNTGQSVTEKIRVTNAADAAAYSAAIVEARGLNYDAYLNRAMVANEIVIAQMLSYGSWLEYVANAAEQFPAHAADMNFFVLPNPKVAVLDVVFGGTAYLAAEMGQSPQQLARAVVDDGIGPIVAINDAVVQALALSQTAVQAQLDANSPQSAIAKSVVTAMDPALHAEIVLASHTYAAFTKDYAKHPVGGGADARGRFADVTLRSRDAFTKERDWTLDSFDVPLLRKNGALKKRGGTELIGYDEWRAVDTLELHGQRWGTHCGHSFLPGWCNDVREPIGWGALEVDAGAGDKGHGTHGNAYGDNPTTAKWADGSMRRPGYSHFSGMPDTPDVADLDAKADNTTAITVMVWKAQSDTLTSGNDAQAKAGGELDAFGDHPAGGKLLALSRATVYFDRIDPRADGKTEIASLYNPYWRVRLTAPTAADRAYAATQQGGLALPSTP